MSIFKFEINDDDLKRIQDEIDCRVDSHVREHGDFIKKENEIASSVLNYNTSEIQDTPYDLFRAREYVKIFPEDEPFSPSKTSGIRRFYHRIVRRLLRQQIVFNEFILSALEEIWSEQKKLEDRIAKIEKSISEKASGHDNS